jgi:hypothetical protein
MLVRFARKKSKKTKEKKPVEWLDEAVWVSGN